MSDIVERLRGCIRSAGYAMTITNVETIQEAADEIERLRTDKVSIVVKAKDAEIERLRAEVEDWKDRWTAERRDHEATIRHFDKLMNEVT